MPFISVVIPLYNKENYIGSTIENVLNQSFQDFEIVIVDDGSTDNSFAIANSFNDSRIRLLQQKNAGPSAARNKGVELSESNFIALLDADDVWKKNHLEELYNSISKFPDAALFCNAYQLKLQKNFTHNATYNLQNMHDIQLVEDYFSASIIHPLAWTSAVAFNKSDFWDLGGFDPKIPSGQDIDLWIKFGLKKTIVFNPTYTACYDKTVPASLSKKHIREVKYQFLNRYKNNDDKFPGFKRFLDINRYAVAIQCKYYNDYDLLKRLKKDIHPSSLTKKQLFLLNSPPFLVKLIKKLHTLLIRNNIYLTAFR